jgi:hypothetical protein
MSYLKKINEYIELQVDEPQDVSGGVGSGFQQGPEHNTVEGKVAKYYLQ